MRRSPGTSTRPSNFVFKPGDGPMHCCSPKAKVSLCVLARRISSKWAAVADINGAILGKKDLADLVHGSEVGEWREMLVVLGRWVEADSFASLVGELGERLWATEEEKREAARVCCMAGKKLERLVAIWGEEAKKEEDQDGNFGLCVFGFIASDRGSNAGTYPLAPLHDLFLEYAQILSVQRMASEAWLKGAFEKKAEVKPALATTSTTAGQYAANHGVGSYDGRNPPPASAGPYSTPLPLRAPSAPSNYGTTPAPSTVSYGAPPARSSPYAPSPSTSTAKPSVSYGSQGEYNPLPSQQLGYGAPSQNTFRLQWTNRLARHPLESFPPLDDAISPAGTTLLSSPPSWTRSHHQFVLNSPAPSCPLPGVHHVEWIHHRESCRPLEVLQGACYHRVSLHRLEVRLERGPQQHHRQRLRPTRPNILRRTRIHPRLGQDHFPLEPASR
ncbi:protein transporter SEC31, putative [Rhizoctonia solani AG-3 Rhs1AP]|uniref:Protein transporter SEC31, putative n=1 Tax=Rhizoctonia solani AG-3 Rhs1AP TaxID=1086054 RepID=X8IYH1_9AGAM|nr:protein transporter SEC31, putative [Rhizoctonia solani AG-3 Rhs1AP]